VPDAVTSQLAEVAVTAVSAGGPVASVGIGVPGLYDPATGRTRFLVNIPGPWDGHPVAGPVAAAVGVPAFLVNDARAFGLAELRLGAGRGAHSMVGLTLGTGVGGVIAVDGRVHQGHDGTGGELGHQTIDPDGPWCGCGNRGCVEAFARADQIAILCGTATAEEAVARARAGDERARDGLAQVGRYLGIGIANMVAVVSPDRVVIGGGIAAAGDLLFDPIRAELRRRVFITSLDEVRLVPAELGTLAGAIGAAVHGAECAAETAGTSPNRSDVAGPGKAGRS
jgi:glucokinase